MWLALLVGGGGQLGGTKAQSAHARWLVFFALITGTMLSDFHLSIGSLSLPPLCPQFAVAQYCVLLHVCLLFSSNWMSLINLIWGLFINVLRVCLHGLVQTRTPGSCEEGQRPFQENTNNSLWRELHMEQLVCLLDMKYIMTIQMSKPMCSNLEVRRGVTWRHN